MKRFPQIGLMTIVLLGCGVVAAQTAGTKADDHAGHHPEKAATPSKTAPKAPESPKGVAGQGGMGSGMMMNDCMGKGMMGSAGGGTEGCGMMGMCPDMLGTASKLEVTRQPKGVTISITSDDAKVVARVQKMAEAMRLMHEARSQ